MTEVSQEAVELSKTVVATVMGREVTHGELSMAFDAVADKAHWKNPINAVVDLDEFTKAMVAKAVVFFAGCEASFERMGGTTTSGVGRYRVKAKGYYLAVGA
jgi:hypothetical protein